MKVSCKYDHPLVTGDRIEVLLGISRVGSSSVIWDFEIIRLSDGIRAARGSITTVRVNHEGRPDPLSAEERAGLAS